MGDLVARSLGSICTFVKNVLKACKKIVGDLVARSLDSIGTFVKNVL